MGVTLNISLLFIGPGRLKGVLNLSLFVKIRKKREIKKVDGEQHQFDWIGQFTERGK